MNNVLLIIDTLPFYLAMEFFEVQIQCKLTYICLLHSLSSFLFCIHSLNLNHFRSHCSVNESHFLYLYIYNIIVVYIESEIKYKQNKILSHFLLFPQCIQFYAINIRIGFAFLGIASLTCKENRRKIQEK